MTAKSLAEELSDDFRSAIINGRIYRKVDGRILDVTDFSGDLSTATDEELVAWEGGRN